MESKNRREILKGLLTGLAGLAAAGAWAKASEGFGAGDAGADRPEQERNSGGDPAPSKGGNGSRVVRANHSVKRHGR
jgi:hypothetical protein